MISYTYNIRKPAECTEWNAQRSKISRATEVILLAKCYNFTREAVSSVNNDTDNYDTNGNERNEILQIFDYFKFYKLYDYST